MILKFSSFVFCMAALVWWNLGSLLLLLIMILVLSVVCGWETLAKEGWVRILRVGLQLLRCWLLRKQRLHQLMHVYAILLLIRCLFSDNVLHSDQNILLILHHCLWWLYRRCVRTVCEIWLRQNGTIIRAKVADFVLLLVRCGCSHLFVMRDNGFILRVEHLDMHNFLLRRCSVILLFIWHSN